MSKALITDPTKPPYYTYVDAIPNGGGGYTRLNVQNSIVVTSGTTETDMYLYNIPANTLINNGDELHIYYGAIQGTTAVSHITRLYLNASVVNSNDNSGDFATVWNIKAVKYSSTQLQFAITILTQNGAPETIYQIESGLDFTTINGIKFTGQCTGAGTLQAYLMTIDKITNTP